MSSISKPDHCAQSPSLVLISAYQEYLMTFKVMTSQMVQRARPLSGRIWPLRRQRVKFVKHMNDFFDCLNLFTAIVAFQSVTSN